MRIVLYVKEDRYYPYFYFADGESKAQKLVQGVIAREWRGNSILFPWTPSFMVSSLYAIIPQEVLNSRLRTGFEMRKTYAQVHTFHLLTLKSWASNQTSMDDRLSL